MDGHSTYGYDVENQLTSVTGANTLALSYDPLGRLYQLSGGATVTTQFLHDGDALVAEYSSSGALLRRYVHGAAVDEVLVWYEGSGTTDKRWLHADERGSIIAISDGDGDMLGITGYGPYGTSGTGPLGRFGYTGQAHIDGTGLYYFKARIYAPALGRFPQTDPVGYTASMNLYAYASADPINRTDPGGLMDDILEDIVVTASRPNFWIPDWGLSVLPDYGYLADIASSVTGNWAASWAGPVQLEKGVEATKEVAESNKQCPRGTGSIFARIADDAGTVGNYADGTGLGAAALGIATAPTGAGGAFFGGTAILAGIVGRGAAVVQTGAYALDGNYTAASSSALGLVGGELVGRASGGLAGRFMARNRMFGDLSAGQERRANLFGDTAGAADSRIASRAVCE